jgi:tetratricopeptide (TPR) repeat protein
MGYRWDAANSLRFLALTAAYQGDFSRSNALLGEVLGRVREIEYPFASGLALATQGLVLFYQEDSRAGELLEESVRIFRQETENSEMGEKGSLAFALTGLGQVAAAQGDLERAETLLEEAMVLYGEVSEKHNQAASLTVLGRVLAERGKVEGAARLLRQAFDMSRDLGSRRGMAEALEGMAELDVLQGRPERTARLLGAAEAIREAIAAPLPPVERRNHQRWAAAAGEQLGETDFHTAWEAGRLMGSNPGEIALDR